MSTIVVRAGVWLVLLVANAASGAGMPVEPSTRPQERIVAAVSLPAVPLRASFEAQSSSIAGAPAASLQSAPRRSSAVAAPADRSDRSSMGMVMLISLAMVGTVIVKGSRS